MAKKYCLILLNLSCLAIFFCIKGFSAYGQSWVVQPDDTTQTVISGGTGCAKDCIVSGGSRSGSNLFHSFRAFSIPEDVTVTFADDGAANIFARVSDQASWIDGTLAVTAEANFFLLNPHGITFGPEALLLSAGSFVASTADSILFAEGAFSALPDSAPLLTVSAPIGLQFGDRPGAIVNHSEAVTPGRSNVLGAPAGLRVDPGRTLALVGSFVDLAGGNLTASGGRIAISSVAAGSEVFLSSDLTLGYEGVSAFGDIQLTDDAIVDASGEHGQISMRSRNFTLADQSAIFNYSAGSSAGTINLRMDESINLRGIGIFVSPLDNSRNDGADLNVVTRRLTLQNGTIISGGTFGSGSGGNVFIEASESFEMEGASSFSPTLIRTSTQGTGTGGNVTINTQRFVSRGGWISVNSLSSGETGNLEIDARTVRLSRGARLEAEATFGNGGNVRLRNLETLVMREGSIISAVGGSEGVGNGGNIDIEADFIVAVPSEDSDIIANATQGRGGNITINTRGLYGIAERRAEPGNGTNDIDASSDFGVSGLIAVNRLTPAAEQRVVVLSSQPLEPADLVTQGCAAAGDRFIVTGRGGLPIAPTDVAEISSPLVDLGDRYFTNERVGAPLIEEDPLAGVAQATPAPSGSDVISRPVESVERTELTAPAWLEANGWTRNQDNQVVLIALSEQEAFSQQLAANCTGE